MNRASKLTLDRIRTALETRYGAPRVPPPRSAFEWIVWENACYLVDDERRGRVFAELKREIGLTPRALLDADAKRMLVILAPGGMKPPMRRGKLLDSAMLCVEKHGGNLDRFLGAASPDEQRKAVASYPSIGKPGADKILLFTGRAIGLPLESNGLRALTRLGFGAAAKSYDRWYRDVQDAIELEVGDDDKRLRSLHLLLRQLGQSLCLRTTPICGECPLGDACPASSA